MHILSAPSMPLNVFVSPINATAVSVRWEGPTEPNGIIRYYTVSIVNEMFLNHTNSLSLTVNIYGLTPNTNYTVNIRAVTVEPGHSASISFITPSCKCVIVLMCYVIRILFY